MNNKPQTATRRTGQRQSPGAVAAVRGPLRFLARAETCAWPGLGRYCLRHGLDPVKFWKI